MAGEAGAEGGWARVGRGYDSATASGIGASAAPTTPAGAARSPPRVASGSPLRAPATLAGCWLARGSAEEGMSADSIGLGWPASPLEGAVGVGCRIIALEPGAVSVAPPIPSPVSLRTHPSRSDSLSSRGIPVSDAGRPMVGDIDGGDSAVEGGARLSDLVASPAIDPLRGPTWAEHTEVGGLMSRS